jgi:K(+)-stimulated pyrophosphate-energized sodium pump
LTLLPVDQTGYFIPTPICFVMGAVTSATTSIIGMSIATKANVRTANAARTSLNSALRVAFNAGTVMGLSVVCLGLIMISVTYIIFRNLEVLAGFGFGASSIALFARVGGGIYTKAADVGADLVGKVEAGIPEDDPRNPGVIADNVGDNVGDVAGMGADLFESYVGSLIAAMVIGAEFYGPVGVACPLYLSGGGILCSVIGSALVSTEEKSGSAIDQQTLLWAIRRGIFSAAGANVLLGALIIFLLFDPLNQAWAIFLCFVIGLGSGVLIGLATEYSTSFSYRPTQAIAEAGLTGPAPVIIKGLSIGMLSTSAPIVIIVVALILTVVLGDAAGGPDSGVYGIAIAAVGMLSTLGVTLATDAYGPVADNAGGLAEMAELPHEVRNITDALDALGNTTAATGKGFAIGSAVLTSLALLNAFASAGGVTTISLLDKEVISGVILGSTLPYIFSALTMTAVAEAAMQIIVEIRRQFREIDGLLEGREGVNADHRKCVDISTQSSLKKMIAPGVLAVVCPIAIGFAGKQKMLGGLLAGSIASGSLLAITMANAGGAWDNAKKYVEGNNLMDENGNAYKKGSEVHKSVVVGDTVGDPFKDTSGPALNILIKLMTIISLVIAPTLKWLYPDA